MALSSSGHQQRNYFDSVIFAESRSSFRDFCVLDCEGLQQVTALQSLDINCCHKLFSFPEEGTLEEIHGFLKWLSELFNLWLCRWSTRCLMLDMYHKQLS